jgi:hypothetical protein
MKNGAWLYLGVIGFFGLIVVVQMILFAPLLAVLVLLGVLYDRKCRYDQ